MKLLGLICSFHLETSLKFTLNRDKHKSRHNLSILDYTQNIAICQPFFKKLDLSRVIIYNVYIKNLKKGEFDVKIAVITGASSGLGAEFAYAVDKLCPKIDEIWLVARREDKLKEVAEKLSLKTKILTMDITDNGALKDYEDVLKENKAEISLLINNAGFGKLGDFSELSVSDNGGMVRLNCEALTVFTAVSLPYIKENGEIINSCSIASFAPNSRMAVYSSTKAYVMSFSRALREELKSRKINVLAVCPGPMDTEFLSLAGIEKGTSRTFDTLPRVKPEAVAINSIKASKKKKAVYTNHIFYKFYRILAKILPHSLVMKMAKT